MINKTKQSAPPKAEGGKGWSLIGAILLITSAINYCNAQMEVIPTSVAQVSTAVPNIPPMLVNNAAWTVMVYAAYDSDIPSNKYEFWDNIVDESYPVNIIFYEDAPGPDNTAIYKLGHGKPILLKELGEPNTGDGETLRKFIDFARKNYPAQHYMLHIIGHTKSVLIGIGTDGPEILSYEEIREVLADLDRPIDVLSLVGCGTGTFEIFYHFRKVARYIIGSQEYSQGYDDVRWGKALLKNANLTPKELAYRAADGLFKRGNREHPQSTVACDTSELENMRIALGEFVDAVILSSQAPDNLDLSIEVREVVQSMGNPNGYFSALVDLYDFSDRIGKRTSDTLIKSKSEALCHAVEKAAIYSFHDEDQHKDCHGLNIMFMYPGKRLGRFDTVDSYQALIKDYEIYRLTNWASFVSLTNSKKEGK